MSAPAALVTDWGGVPTCSGMLAVVRRARAAGIRTAVLSNASAREMPIGAWAEVVDVVVAADDLRRPKPHAEAFRHTAAFYRR